MGRQAPNMASVGINFIGLYGMWKISGHVDDILDMGETVL
jgi:hypothetical protein